MTLRGRVQLSLAVLLAEILAPCIGNGVGAAFTAAGLWVAVLEPQGYRETWSIATSGEVTIWSHSDRRAIVGELAGIKKEARLSAGFTHRIDFGEPGAYDLLSVQGGRMEIERYRPGRHVRIAHALLRAYRADAHRPLSQEDLASTCVPEQLSRTSCVNDPAALALLNITCRACRTSACDPSSHGALVEAASEMLRRASSSDGALGPRCDQAVGAALAVVSQLPESSSAVLDASALSKVKELRPSKDLSLSPFPFNGKQLDYLATFTPTVVDPPCSGQRAAEVQALWDHRGRKRFLSWFEHMQVWAQPTRPALLPSKGNLLYAKCPLVASDDMLAARCRSRIGRVRAGNIPKLGAYESDGWWRCPANGTSSTKGSAGGKYEEQQSHRGCHTGAGTWGKRIEGRLKCVAVVVAELLSISPGERVLDWGSGCGWTLTWMRQLFGVEGFGIDATPSNIAWAREHSSGDYCFWSSIDLSWVPDASFDAVITYWALYHLRDERTLCHVARQLVDKLRPGGRAWFGGNMPAPLLNIGHTPMTMNAWQRCLLGTHRGSARTIRHDLSRSVAGGGLEIEFIPDVELFSGAGLTLSDVEIRNRVSETTKKLGAPSTVFGTLAEDNDNPGDYLFWPPVYSVVIRKLRT
eukprot:TRINITY_DN7861_c0_g1_i1.p1 TRINITY_DN7861_c0_g1~~TRINITY_DN7861_c0_g1_i1.p1  ORF type:complete len:651 (-),score=74.86 TRINITY_DN7861_c0_g1_i1:4-1917(-)